MSFSLHSLSKNAQNYFLHDDACMITYSQFGEDIIISNLLAAVVKTKGGGFYVDAGAFHPRKYSNTKILFLKGWKGINIDANESSIATFSEERPDDTNICCGVAATKGEMTYYKFSGANNTFSHEMAKKQEAQGHKLLETLKIPTLPINSILEEHLPNNQHIDYMNIDIEGFDDAIVQSLDLAKYRPTILSVELHEANQFSALENPTINYLARNYYSLASINYYTYIFFDKLLTIY